MGQLRPLEFLLGMFRISAWSFYPDCGMFRISARRVIILTEVFGDFLHTLQIKEPSLSHTPFRIILQFKVCFNHETDEAPLNNLVVQLY
jgi:hypothetical protein